MSSPHQYLAVIRIVGVGGGGVNALNRMIEANLRGVEFVAVNTDAQTLLMSDADIKIDIGRELTQGLGAGSDPEVGEAAAKAAEEQIRQAIDGSDMVFITAGEGGGTGTGAAPVIAEISRELGALTIAVVTRPFRFEGRKRAMQADKGIDSLKDKVDTQIVIPNDRLLNEVTEGTTLIDAFQLADDVLLHGVQGITDLITTPGLINTDFADVRTILKDAGSALMGVGMASGEERAANAARKAVSSPLLESSIEGARGLLLTITGNSQMSLKEVTTAAEGVAALSHDDANVIFGTVIDDTLGDSMRVTVIAAGFERWDGRRSSSSPSVADDVLSFSSLPDPFAEKSSTESLDFEDDLDLPSFLR